MATRSAAAARVLTDGHAFMRRGGALCPGQHYQDLQRRVIELHYEVSRALIRQTRDTHDRQAVERRAAGRFLSLVPRRGPA